MKFILLINVKLSTIIFCISTFIKMINTTSERLKAKNFFLCRYFSIYEQLKFRAQLFYKPGISLRFVVAGKHCQETGQIYCFMEQPNGPIFKVAGTEGQVGGCFCQLQALNQSTVNLRPGLRLCMFGNLHAFCPLLIF